MDGPAANFLSAAAKIKTGKNKAEGGSGDEDSS